MKLAWSVLVVGVVPLVTGCGPEKGETSGDTLGVALRVVGPTAFAEDVCGNTLSSARMVIREFELDQAEDEDGEDLERGPWLIDIAAGDFNGVIQANLLQAEVAPGTYDEVEFEIHALENATGDAAIDEMHAAGASIIIAGTTSGGSPFTWTSSLNETQEKELAPPVVVGDSVSGVEGVTLSINPQGWFRHPDSLACLNPTDAANQSTIEDNVTASIDLDEDEDQDGVPDADDPDDDPPPDDEI